MSLSPLTNATFSARSLKICSMRGPRPSQLESSLLILTLLSLVTCTTTVLFSRSWFCCWFGFGCGTSVSKPLGVSGVITMKIIKSTSKISISGTTFISAIAPPLLSPTCIPIASLLLTQRLAGKTSVKPAARQLVPNVEKFPKTSLQPCEGPELSRYAGWEPTHRNPERMVTAASVASRRRGRRLSCSFIALGQQPELVNAGGANLVHDGHNVAVLGASIALQKDR